MDNWCTPLFIFPYSFPSSQPDNAPHLFHLRVCNSSVRGTVDHFWICFPFRFLQDSKFLYPAFQHSAFMYISTNLAIRNKHVHLEMQADEIVNWEGEKERGERQIQTLTTGLKRWEVKEVKEWRGQGSVGMNSCRTVHFHFAPSGGLSSNFPFSFTFRFISFVALQNYFSPFTPMHNFRPIHIPAYIIFTFHDDLHRFSFYFHKKNSIDHHNGTLKMRAMLHLFWKKLTFHPRACIIFCRYLLRFVKYRVTISNISN